MQQRVATTRLDDGTQIAYATAGQGPFLVHAPGWLTHLELSWALPPERGFCEALARSRTLLRYDKPGCGLSGPAGQPPSMELELATLAAVTRTAGAEQFDLLGTSQGAAVAASWAAGHPETVHRLLLFGAWQSLPGTAWRIGAQPWAALLWVVYAAGWLITVAATFMVDHLDFTGLRQACWPARAGAYRPPSFTERWLYAWVRHPMMLGLLLAFWATPDMTAGHLFFAAAGTLYIAVGVRLEERDLRRQLGRAYQDYARRVPAVLPRPGAPGGVRARATARSEKLSRTNRPACPAEG